MATESNVDVSNVNRLASLVTLVEVSPLNPGPGMETGMQYHLNKACGTCGGPLQAHVYHPGYLFCQQCKMRSNEQIIDVSLPIAFLQRGNA
jgi:hypothetical protein